MNYKEQDRVLAKWQEKAHEIGEEIAECSASGEMDKAREKFMEAFFWLQVERDRLRSQSGAVVAACKDTG